MITEAGCLFPIMEVIIYISAFTNYKLKGIVLHVSTKV